MGDGLAIVTDEWNRNGGGREQYVAEIAGALAARGWHVDVLAHRVSSDQESTKGVALHHVGSARWRGASALQRAVVEYRNAHPNLPVLSTRPMAFATHGQLHSGIAMDAFAAERRSFDAPLRRALFWPALRLNLWRRHLLSNDSILSSRTPPNVMTFSAEMRDRVCRRFATVPARVTVLPLGIDLDRFHASGRGAPPTSVVRVLFAGHNFRLKGLGPAMATLAQARARGVDARLTVAGDGPLSTARRRARRLGVAAHVDFTGRLSPDVMPPLYRTAHVLLHPTFYDPFPRVVLEALACGCPVVTTRACGVAEHMTGALERLVVSDARDVRSLTDAIVESANPTRWGALSVAAADLGAQFDFGAHVTALVEWLTTSTTRRSPVRSTDEVPSP